MNGWSEIDKKKLQIGYREGVSLKILAQVLNRTPTAVSKALTRFGIRPLGMRPPGMRTGSVFSGKLTGRELSKIFEAEIGKEHAYRPVFDTVPEEKMSKSNMGQEEMFDPAGHLGWVPFDTVITFLKKNGYHVKKCTKELPTSNIHRCDYFLNERPYGVEQVLLIANRIRFLQGEDPFLVENVTQ